MFKWNVFFFKHFFFIIIVFLTINAAVKSNLFNFNKNENFYNQQRYIKYDSNNMLSQVKQYSPNQNTNYQKNKWTNVLRSVAGERGLTFSKCVNIPKNFSLCYGIQVCLKT